MADKSYFYGFIGMPKVEASYAIIASTSLVCDYITIILFDSYSTIFFISVKSTLCLDMVCKVLDTAHMYVFTLVGVFIIID